MRNCDVPSSGRLDFPSLLRLTDNETTQDGPMWLASECLPTEWLEASQKVGNRRLKRQVTGPLHGGESAKAASAGDAFTTSPGRLGAWDPLGLR